MCEREMIGMPALWGHDGKVLDDVILLILFPSHQIVGMKRFLAVVHGPFGWCFLLLHSHCIHLVTEFQGISPSNFVPKVFYSPHPNPGLART